MTWQPISTAPKDGRFIDAYNAAMGVRLVVFWLKDYKTFDRQRNKEVKGKPRWASPIHFFDSQGMTFTHWQPLPPVEDAK